MEIVINTENSSQDSWTSQRSKRRGGQGNRDRHKAENLYYIDTVGSAGDNGKQEEPMETEHHQPDQPSPPFDPKSLIGKPFIMTQKRASRQGEEGEGRGEGDSSKGGGGGRGGLLIVDKSLMKSLSASTQKTREEVFDVSKEAWPSMSSGVVEGASDSSKLLPDWSTIVKTEPKPLPQQVKPSELMDIEADEKSETKKAKKKKKKTEKKLDTPLTLELGSILDALQHSKVDKKSLQVRKVTAGTVALPPPPPPSTAPTVGDGSTKLKNVLDSSAPTTMRGKERETPKKRKPSALRKIINKEREERKKEGKPIPTIIDMQTVEPAATSAVLPGLHNRKFREYCTHLVTDKINSLVESLLTDLSRFQERLYKNEPLKFKSKRRYVCGLREVKKHLVLKHIKCVIIPPNMQRIQSPGGIDDTLNSIIDSAREQEVPLVFALNRKRLAAILKKKFNVGCIGLISYAGAEETYKKLIDQVRVGTEQYKHKKHRILKGMAGASSSASLSTQHADMHVPSLIPPLPDGVSDPKYDTIEEEEDDDDNEGDGEEEDYEENDAVVPGSEWRTLFGEVDTDKTATLMSSTNTAYPASVPVLSNAAFSWNLDAPEFMPYNIPANNL